MEFLVTAGPTHEPIDAVRYIGNRSSGRMGLAIAAAARAAGHRVTLLLGPVPLSDQDVRAAASPANSHPDSPSVVGSLEVVRFTTADDLRRHLHAYWPAADILLMAAAVADFRPVSPLPSRKLERGSDLTLALSPVPDLLAELRERSRPGQRRVGFALEEPARLAERAKAKLDRKGLDAIVANPLETMDALGVAGEVYLRDGRILRPEGWPKQISKEAFAAWLVAELVQEWS
jgi:phosphopantothenoylcysteine decarboxylase / phosphopantothenate---cysteine ligase